MAMLKELLEEELDEARRKSSIQLGSASKGRIKIYFDAADPEDMINRIENAMDGLATAKEGYDRVFDKLYGDEE